MDVLVTGSSHALMHAAMIRKVCTERSLSVSFVCDASYNPYSLGREEASKRDEKGLKLFDEALHAMKPTLVISLERYESRYKEHDKGVVVERYQKYVKEILDSSSYALTIAQPPFAGVRENLYRAANKGGKGVVLTESNKTRELRDSANSVIRGVFAEFPSAIFIESEDLFLLEDGSTRFANEDNVLYYLDDDHLNDVGSALLSDRLGAALDAVFELK